MYFVALGVVLLLLKVLDIASVGSWSWWSVLWPFGAAVAWWAYADKSGLTKRREMQKMDDRRAARRKKQLVALGRNPRNDRDARAGRAARKRVSGFDTGQPPSRRDE